MLNTSGVSFCYILGRKLGGCFAVSQASHKHIISAWRACWLDPEGTLGTFWGSFCYVFGHEIKWCLAAWQASQTGKCYKKLQVPASSVLVWMLVLPLQDSFRDVLLRSSSHAMLACSSAF